MIEHLMLCALHGVLGEMMTLARTHAMKCRVDSKPALIMVSIMDQNRRLTWHHALFGEALTALTGNDLIRLQNKNTQAMLLAIDNYGHDPSSFNIHEAKLLNVDGVLAAMAVETVPPVDKTWRAELLETFRVLLGSQIHRSIIVNIEPDLRPAPQPVIPEQSRIRGKGGI